MPRGPSPLRHPVLDETGLITPEWDSYLRSLGEGSGGVTTTVVTKTVLIGGVGGGAVEVPDSDLLATIPLVPNAVLTTSAINAIAWSATINWGNLPTGIGSWNASPTITGPDGLHVTGNVTAPYFVGSGKYLTDLPGGGMNLDYLGSFAAGPTYNDGDIVIGADGVAYICVVDGTTTAPEPWPGVGISTAVGPKGDKGDPGEAGPPGPTGPKGDPGVNAAVDATYWTVTPHANLTNERALNSLSNGYVKSTAGEPSTVSVIPVVSGGTGATDPSTARANLGCGTVSPVNLSGDANTYLNGIGAWTNITVSGTVPSGLIAIFMTACPAGWTRVPYWDGRFLRSNTAYGAVGGGSTHTHGSGSLAAGSHTHGPGTYAGPDHNHGGSVNVSGSGTTNSAGSHNHHFNYGIHGITEGSNQGTMNVDAGNSGFMARGDHNHNLNWDSSGDTDGVGDHQHGFSWSGSGGISHDGGQGISGTSAGSTASVTGSTAAADHTPPFVDVVFCQKN